MWTKAFACKKTEKEEDKAYSEQWSWGVYNDQFVMRYHNDVQAWKATEMGKIIGSPGATTCYSSLNDIRHVFLMHDINAPSCKPETPFGAPTDEAEMGGDKEATLQSKSRFSFTITSTNLPSGSSAAALALKNLAKQPPLVNTVTPLK